MLKEFSKRKKALSFFSFSMEENFDNPATSGDDGLLYFRM